MDEIVEALPLAKIQQRMVNLKDWALEGNAIMKEVSLNNFIEAMEFVNDVAQIAQKYNHHPTMLIEYTTVRLTMTTHDAHGLTDKDFDVAEEIDKICKEIG